MSHDPLTPLIAAGKSPDEIIAAVAADAEVLTTPCGEGDLVWRRWGSAVLGQLPPRPRQWIVHQLQRGVSGLGALREPATVIRCILLSVLQWSCIVGAVAASAWAVGAPIPVSGAIAVFVLTVIGLTLPSSPAQLGTTQLAFVVGFELVGAAAAPAFAASLVYTAAVVVMMMAVGAVCWMTAAWAPLAPQKSK